MKFRRHWRRWLLGLSLVGLSAWSLQRQVQALWWQPASHKPFAEFAEALPPLDWQQALQSPGFDSYLTFYGLDFPQTQHHAGSLETPQGQIFVQMHKPLGPLPARGTVLAMHGYFVHGGLMNHLAAALLEGGYAVVLADLPGHGLSAGPRADITDFSDYARVVSHLSSELVQHVPGPLFLLGHSTGGAGVWEYLLREPQHPYQRAVLAAPLVRSWLWDLSATGFYLGQGWLKDLPRMLREDTSDPALLAAIRRDPLQHSLAPLSWVKALMHWNEHVIEDYAPVQTPLLILQGTADTVVEWQYNLPFLQRKFPQAQVQILEDARHDLFWETPLWRERIFKEILDYLAAES